MPSFNANTRRTLLLLGLTAVLIGYLTVWLPGPSAGLRLIGVEIGEWIKFLGVRQTRDIFYLPPIALGLIIALLTVGAGAAAPRAWGLRALAVAVSLLSFPAVAAIQFEPRSEWLLRLVLVGLVAAAALLSAFVPARRTTLRWATPRWAWVLIALIALLGVALPTWQYFIARGVVERILLQSVGVGLGVWLNGLGFLLIGAMALSEAVGQPRESENR